MRTFGVPSSFVSSPETEKERFLYSCCNVASGFYSRHGWLILPTVEKGFEKICEIIPEIAENLDSNFWKDAAKGGSLMPKVISKRMWRDTQKINFKGVDQKIVNKFENDWKKIENESFLALESVFSTELKWIKSLEVRITNIGSPGSHYLLSKKKNQHLIIYLRSDADAKDILNLLVLALIYPISFDLDLSFSERQVIRNFILTRPLFNKMYPDCISPIFDKTKIPTVLRMKSDKYIKFLNIPDIIDPITEINRNLNIFGPKESLLLKKLIDNREKILTYDDIADLIWGQGRFKSYWAINKLIQRIGKKLETININIQIDGIRGVGYSIK